MRLTLPTGRVVELREEERAPPASPEGAGLFDAAARVVAAHWDGDVGSLALPDFHALRAVAARLGWLDEEPVVLACVNCREEMRVRPCATFELGPFADGELDDPELDRLRGADDASDGVRVQRRTVAEAAPLHRALARGPLRVTPRLARAMGVVELHGERDPRRIARALRDCDDEAFSKVERAFLEAAYPRRLGASHACPRCGARNEVDAPFARELSGAAPRPADEAPFPSFEEFDAEAQRLGARLPGDVVLVVDGGVAACDAGGAPLLGSYVPPFEGSDAAPSRPPEITVYYRTFVALHEDEGAYDWRGELEETLAHELEHHGHHLAGHDPMDEEERAEIARDARRAVGRRETARREARGAASDVVEFARRTWPLWVTLLIVALAYSFCGGSGD